MSPSIAVVFAVIVIGVVFVILFVLLIRHRNQQMLHQERLAALEKGIAIPAEPPLASWSPRAYLLRGLIWSFSGAALFGCLLGLAASSHRPESAQQMAWNAKSVSDTLNIPLDQARQIVEKDQSEHGMPPAVALLGLIPLGVGLAYLVFYYSDPARKELARSPET